VITAQNIFSINKINKYYQDLILFVLSLKCEQNKWCLMITFFETFRIETISERLKCNENNMKLKNNSICFHDTNSTIRIVFKLNFEGEKILAIHGGQNENKSLLWILQNYHHSIFISAYDHFTIIFLYI